MQDAVVGLSPRGLEISFKKILNFTQNDSCEFDSFPYRSDKSIWKDSMAKLRGSMPYGPRLTFLLL